MCRIVGFWDLKYKGSYSLEDVVTDMRDTLIHGGPDDAGNYTEKNRGLALGHRRLSILDLSAHGHQPMKNNEGSFWITYNGEVYNFCEIKDELEGEGHKFKSSSDTEVILTAYAKWGIKSVHKFRGMFAFAIWDKRKEKLILCRDRVGVKPLYYYRKNGLFMFASELKAFHKHPGFCKELDEKALGLYLQFGYIPAPYSIFKHTYKLRPGHYLEADKYGDVKEIKYWDAEDYYKEGLELQENGYFENKKDEDIGDELEDILSESFKLRLVSDVPIGVFLSGGLDSSIVTALIQKNNNRAVKTFTIGFKEEKHNEAIWARKVANHLGTDHAELYCTHEDALSIIPRLPEIYDEPFGDSSAIPTHLLSKLAREKVKVALSADGGDEFFCGYPKYWIIAEKAGNLAKIPLMDKIANLISPDMVLNVYKAFKPILPDYQNLKDRYKKIQWILGTKDVVKQSILVSSAFANEDLNALGYGNQDIISNGGYNYDPISSMMLFDCKNYLPDDILAKVDRASMAVALETREPMLDHKILEYTAKIPLLYKYRKGTSKYILRKILYKHVPQDLVCRPKHGFGIPIYEWFKTDMQRYYTEYLNKKRLEREGYLNAEYVDALLSQCINEKGISHSKLWVLLMFQMWREKWL
jgi:asparagine synthase (glutamine-hydrolysing)